jgi:hypothetical protein
MLSPELVYLETILFEDSTIPLTTLSKFHPLVRIPILSFQAADIVATELAIRTIEAGGAGALDLYTPEIRRYEETALVGMGGMRI